MPNVSHSTLTGAEVHEPKGISGATNNQSYVANGSSSGTWKEPEPKGVSGASLNSTYVANGSGSGSWSEPEPKGVSSSTANKIYVADGSGSGSWKTIYTQGFEDYNHAGSSQVLTAGTSTKLLNDGAGTDTNTAYRLPGNTAIWSTVNNQFDWSGAGLALGDTVDIRLDFTVTTTGANDDLSILLNMAVGSGADYSLTTEYNEWRTAGTYPFTTYYSVYMGETDTLNYPAEVHMLAGTGSDTVQVNGWFVRTVPRSPAFN